MPEPRTERELEAEVLDELVTANRILAHQAVVDGYGHVSARHPTRPDRYFLSRRMPPELVTKADIVELTLDSDPLTPGDHPLFLERYIHGEIYRVRPDVMAVVHSHSHSVIPLGVSKAETLRSIFHMSAFLGVSTPVFEIRDVRGAETDMLVRDPELGRALANTLGSGSVILMRGHGSTVVGTSLKQAVVYSVYTEINARLQLQATQLGPVTYLSAAEARAATITGARHCDRAWNLWEAQVRRVRGG